MSKSVAERPLLLDACAVINFAASRRFEDLATTYGGFRLVDVVANEAHFVRKGGMEDDANEREAIELDPLVTSGHLTIEPEATDEELESFIQFAVDLGDGESMTLAVALHRGHTVVTDDRKASRIATENGIELVTSLEIFRTWEISANPDDFDVRAALVAVRERARYIPRRSHPLRRWWEQHMFDER